MDGAPAGGPGAGRDRPRGEGSDRSAPATPGRRRPPGPQGGPVGARTYPGPERVMAPYDAFCGNCHDLAPRTALVLGSGMGAVRARVAVVASVRFAEVPGLVASGVLGHRGHLTLGTWSGVPVLLFEGRLHHYEGHAWAVVERPARLAAVLGVERLVL